ncbi:MMPL family transporter [Nocardioides acrostichi]|uniref:MMPL family transporter n=1 Tax=Nocardioides acrostichi TaxID=2784339 RepID=A0A930Y921_9ACTN|nr:MMPL family transporter [Nocardioides acrostichi]MBF4163671.1 MMPL family transporter [Nocardioides acrostichi]
MATLLARLGTTAYRRWYYFMLAWVVLLVLIGGIAAGFSKPLSSEVSIPGIPSQKAADLQTELFPGSESAFDQANVNVVVQAPEGQKLTQAKYRKAIKQLAAGITALPQYPSDPSTQEAVKTPIETAAAYTKQLVGQAQQTGGSVKAARADAQAVSPLSQDQRTGVITFSWDVTTPADVKQSTLDDLQALMDEVSQSSGLTVAANGQGATSAELGYLSETIGLGVALLVLVLTFGSLVSAGMPLFNAVFGVMVGLGGVTAMTAVIDIDQSAPILASMLGLAVGVDYTLFILARYRTELHGTDDRAAAIGIAVGTAGSAVVFAGLTVLIALAALSVVGIPFLTAMGLAAAATVLVAVLVALTLLPAVLGLLKSKAFAGRVRRRGPKHDETGAVLNNGVRWARVVEKRSVAIAVLVVVGLGAIALPLRNLELAFPSDSTKPVGSTQRIASDLMTEAFGPGREGPLLVIVDGRDVPAQKRLASFQRVATWAGRFDGVENAQVVLTNANPKQPEVAPTGAQVLVTPTFGPSSPEAEDLLSRLRANEPEIDDETGTVSGVTGLTAIQTDVSDRLASALPVYLAIVIGLAFVLLMIVFRSILVPLTATVGFLLSVLATLGATVAVFQEGAFGLFDPAPIVSFMPIFLVGVVFGLAMDYQVFLVTRMREAHVHGMSTDDAVVDGFRNSARVVTAAATIMIAVFAAFMLQSDPITKSIGFALAIAIVFDAFIVRMALIPAVLHLLGEKAWWMPRWLDRLLPSVDVEGEKLQRPAASGPTGPLDAEPAGA